MLRAVAVDQLGSFWPDIERWLPEGLLGKGTLDLDLDGADLTTILAERAVVRVSTGIHDSDGVRLRELGAGHQSLVWLALSLLERDEGRREIALVEEPEAFLHPSAQRQVARQLFDDPGLQVLISSHSPVIVDEAEATDIVLVRNHRTFAANEDERGRAQINTALLTGQASEAVFSSSVLLVEGPGDRAFFERLRRRLSGRVPASVLGSMAVLAVGGNTRFGPWVRLLEAYTNRSTGQRPIRWLAVADSADAVARVQKGLVDGGVSVPADLRSLASAIPQTSGGRVADARAVAEATVAFNLAARDRNFPLQLLPVDLEYSALEHARPATVAAFAEVLNISTTDRPGLMSHLGSKGGGTAPKDGSKADWLRDHIARDVRWAEVSPEVRHIVWTWAQNAGHQLGVPLTRPTDLRV